MAHFLYAPLVISIALAIMGEFCYGGTGEYGICGQYQVKPVPSSTSKAYIKSALDATNKFRKEHGSGPLTINEEVCQYTQSWANALAKNRTMKHSGVSCSENMALDGYETKALNDKYPLHTGGEIATLWYNEEKLYNYSNPGLSFIAGHFVNLIWKASNETCISTAMDTVGKSYIVALYTNGEITEGRESFRKNVLPKSSIKKG